MKNSLFVGLSFLALTGSSSLMGQPVPKITELSREWFQRGTTNEVTVTGENLRDAKAIHISGDPGFQAVIIPPDLGMAPVVLETSRGGISVGEPGDAKHLRARVVIASDASLNPRELRVLTSTGISNPLNVNLSTIPEILEAQNGNEPQQVDLPVGISGTISGPGEQDSFRFAAKKGQQLVFDVLAFRVGSALDSSLFIVDSSGKELARSEDAKAFDSFLHFEVPESGEYTAQLRDFRYSGSSKHKYHLEIGALAYVDSVFPAGAQRGGPAVDVQLMGVNLGGIEKVRLQPQTNAPIGWQEVRVHTPWGLSSPFPFQVSDLSEVFESEPNNTTNQANAISIPSIINGRIGTPKDIDVFKFKSDKTQTLICEVTAQRFGSPLDALLTLRDAAGKVLQQNDDSDGADARIEFSFQKDQEYRLAIRDLLERGGANFVYRMTIRAPEPDFAARFFPDNPRISCGGRTVVHCELTRKAGFSGPVRIAAENLPAGISAEPILINGDDPPNGLLVLNAAGNATPGLHSFNLVANATLNGALAAHGAEPISGELPAKEALLTVLASPALFTPELTTLSVVLEQDQSADLDLSVQRREGFAEEIKVTAEGYSTGREPLTQNVDVQPLNLKAGQMHGTLHLKAKPDAEIGSRLIYLKAEATVDGETVTQYSQAIPLVIRQIPFTIRNTMKRLSISVLPPGTQSAAAEAEFAVRASRRGWFTDQIDLSLEGLPEGVTATSTNLPNRIGEVTFKLNATEKAPAPKEFQITVVGSSTVGGRTYRQRTAPMSLSITKSQDVADTK